MEEDDFFSKTKSFSKSILNQIEIKFEVNFKSTSPTLIQKTICFGMNATNMFLNLIVYFIYPIFII